MTYLEKAVEMKPNADQDWFNLGIAYSKSDRLDDAIMAYQRAVEISPNNEYYTKSLTEFKNYVAAIRETRDDT